MHISRHTGTIEDHEVSSLIDFDISISFKGSEERYVARGKFLKRADRYFRDDSYMDIQSIFVVGPSGEEIEITKMICKQTLHYMYGGDIRSILNDGDVSGARILYSNSI